MTELIDPVSEVDPVSDEYLRVHKRMNSRILVTLEALEGEDRKPVQSQTLDVSPKGCLVMLPGCFSVGDTFHVTNSVNQLTTEARVCWRGQATSEGWEYGMELLQPPADFWGLDF